MSGKPLAIPPALLAAVYAEARRAFPAECCGYLTGPRGGGAVSGMRACANQQGGDHPTAPDRDAETAYVIAGEDLLALARSLDGPEPARIIYHSHPNGRAYFSATDTEVARDPWGEGPMYPVQQLVVGVNATRAVEARLYDWDDERRGFVEIARYAGEP